MNMQTFDIAYFDTLEGGSGLVRVSFEGIQGLADWLSSHPGYLIRALRRVGL